MSTNAQTLATRAPLAVARSHFFSETWILYRRSMTKLRRRPIALYFSLIQPIIWLVLYGQMFNRLVSLPGASNAFSASSYTAFFTPGVIMMMILFGAGQTGLGLIQDMDSGFLDKLLATPINRFAIILGKMLGDLTRMIIQSLMILLIAALTGVQFQGGILAVPFIVLIAGLFGMALGGVNTMIALGTRNTETTFLLSNFLTLPLMFTSTAMVPRAFLPDWMQVIASINPVTFGIEGMRALITTEFNISQILPAILMLGVFAALSILGATMMFRRRVA